MAVNLGRNLLEGRVRIIQAVMAKSRAWEDNQGEPFHNLIIGRGTPPGRGKSLGMMESRFDRRRKDNGGSTIAFE